MHDGNVPFTCLQETSLKWSCKSAFAEVKIHKTLVKLLSFFSLNLALCMAAAAFQDSCVSVSLFAHLWLLPPDLWMCSPWNVLHCECACEFACAWNTRLLLYVELLIPFSVDIYHVKQIVTTEALRCKQPFIDASCYCWGGMHQILWPEYMLCLKAHDVHKKICQVSRMRQNVPRLLLKCSWSWRNVVKTETWNSM